MRENTVHIHRLKSCSNTGIPWFEAESTFFLLEEDTIGDKKEQVFGNQYFNNVNGTSIPTELTFILLTLTQSLKKAAAR